jgi:hypothetical protein
MPCSVYKPLLGPSFIIPFYLESVPVLSADCVKTYTVACRRVFSSAPLDQQVQGLLWLLEMRLTITPWHEFASELYRQSDCRLSAKLLPNFEDRGWHVVCVTDPYGSILGFLDRSHYFFSQVTLQLYSRGRVDPIPDPLLLRKSGSAGNRTRTFGSVARNSEH